MRYACRLVVLNLSGLSGKSSGEDLTLVDSMWWPESYRAMFIRVKKIGPYEYLYLVENAREGGRHVQRVIKALGRRDEVETPTRAIVRRASEHPTATSRLRFGRRVRLGKRKTPAACV